MKTWQRCLILGVVSIGVAADAGAAGAKAKAAAQSAPLAVQLCDALHALPASRKLECCGGTAGNLAAVCATEVGAALQRKAVQIDEAALKKCAADTAHELEGCAWVTPLLPRLPPSCERLVEGTLKSGATCRSALECGAGLYCRGVTPTGAGVCAEPAAVGSRCENPADNLVSFVRAKDDARHPSCRGVCLKGQCLARIDEGGACPSTAACVAGLNCIGGHCTTHALPALGEACSGTSECGDAAVCVDAKCSKPKDAGASCKLPFECRSLACDKAPTAESGVCTEVCRAAN
jgi:hypothetical protein